MYYDYLHKYSYYFITVLTFYLHREIDFVFSILSPFNFAENLHYISFSHSIKLFYLHGLKIELPRFITVRTWIFFSTFLTLIFFSLSYFLTFLSGNISKDKCSGRSMKVWRPGKYNRPTNQQTEMGVHRRVTLPIKIIDNSNSLRL